MRHREFEDLYCHIIMHQDKTNADTTETPQSFLMEAEAGDRPTKILSALVEAGKIGEVDSEHVAGLWKSSNEPLDQILAKLGLITEHDLADFYASAAGVEFSSNLPPLNDEITVEDLNPEFCRLHRILPIEQCGDAYKAALIDPFDEDAIAGLAFAIGANIRPIVTTATQWERLYSKYARSTQSEDQNETTGLDFSADADRLKDMASEEPIVRLVSRLIAQASDARASDIHIEPGPRETKVKFRIDGVLQEREQLGRAQMLSAVSRVKILAQLDIAERRRPQDGRFTFPVAGQPVDLRVSTIPTEYGESVVIRLLDQSTVSLDFEELGFSKESRNALQRLIAKPNGIVLVTGPTGSGKTTTLYTMLDQLADGKRKILTIEDPIEQRLGGVSQTQANPVIGLTFAAALKSFLRHDPDVIMVGEIRDIETARMAVQAALTGHLVISTLHTNDATSSITRLIDMGIEDYLIASTLNGVIAQRLVRRLCPACHDQKQETATQCGECNGAGYSGRLVIAEVLEMNDQFRNCLRHGWIPSEVASVLSATRFESMKNDGLAKAFEGLTSKDEISNAVGVDER